MKTYDAIVVGAGRVGSGTTEDRYLAAGAVVPTGRASVTAADMHPAAASAAG